MPEPEPVMAPVEEDIESAVTDQEEPGEAAE